jgi:hypothetical protein
MFPHLQIPTALPSPSGEEHAFVFSAPRLATASHLWIPGAPPASKPLTTPISPRASDGPLFQTIPPTPAQIESTYDQAYFDFEDIPEDDDLPRLLPDPSWIAIVCGVSKEQWNADEGGGDSDLPEGFFVAPRDVYMPDLTAIGDVLLGKLVGSRMFQPQMPEAEETQGYGTVAECVDSSTPFVYGKFPSKFSSY